MMYSELLNDSEWQLKRMEILGRDNYMCTSCKKKRPLLRNLVNSFGINKIEDLINKHVHIIKDDLIKSGNLTYQIGSQIDTCNFLGFEETNYDLKSLRFALQKQDINVFWFAPVYKIVCFLENIIDTEVGADLNIHHNYYIQSKKPWEYDNDTLTTL